MARIDIFLWYISLMGVLYFVSSLMYSAVMPAKATLFSAVCKPLFEFGQGPYNTIRWSPQGRCIQLQPLNVVCSAGSHANLMIHIEEERRKGQKCKGNMFKCLFAPCLGYLQEEDLYVNLTFCMDWIDLQNVCWLNIVAAFRCLMWSEPLMDWSHLLGGIWQSSRRYGMYLLKLGKKEKNAMQQAYLWYVQECLVFRI